MRARPAGTLGLAVTTAAMATLLAAGPAAAGDGGRTTPHDPRGNNGTVKIDDDVPGDHRISNEPQVGCSFSVELFRFDARQRLTLSLEAVAPTPGARVPDPVTVTTDGDGVSDGTAYDGGHSFASSPTTRTHVRLTVATGEPGGVKHKVFWIEPCRSGSSTAVAGRRPAPRPAGRIPAVAGAAAGHETARGAVAAGRHAQGAPAVTTAPSPDAAVAVAGALGAGDAATERGTESESGTRVLGVRLTRPQTRSVGAAVEAQTAADAVVGAGRLAHTGPDWLVPAAAAGASALALGSGLVLAGRRRRSES